MLAHEKASIRSAQMPYPGSVLGKRKRSEMSVTGSGESPGTSKMWRVDSNDSSNEINSMRSPNDTLNGNSSPMKVDGVHFYNHDYAHF